MEKTCDNCGNNEECRDKEYVQRDMCRNPQASGYILAGAMWKPKETGIKEVVFDESHVGQNVFSLSYGNGFIYGFEKTDIEMYPVLVRFDGVETQYTCGGKLTRNDTERTLFIGHNVKITVEEDDLPEKLICPVCGVEHIVSSDGAGLANYFFDDLNNDCPLNDAYYCTKEDARKAMRNLIKAMS